MTTNQLAVVAYPLLADDDRRWIEELRARHDPQVLRIAAHITLVFPVELPRTDVVLEARQAVRGRDPIAIELLRAVALPDAIRGWHYVSLPVGRGQAELHAIHDALYSGILVAHRRGDIPFVPHLTVASHPERGECERIAARLNARPRLVRGRLDSVDVIEVREPTVLTVATIPLGRGLMSRP